jgi:hypothetical protein
MRCLTLRCTRMATAGFARSHQRVNSNVRHHFVERRVRQSNRCHRGCGDCRDTVVGACRSRRPHQAHVSEVRGLPRHRRRLRPRFFSNLLTRRCDPRRGSHSRLPSSYVAVSHSARCNGRYRRWYDRLACGDHEPARTTGEPVTNSDRRRVLDSRCIDGVPNNSLNRPAGRTSPLGLATSTAAGYFSHARHE